MGEIGATDATSDRNEKDDTTMVLGQWPEVMPVDTPADSPVVPDVEDLGVERPEGHDPVGARAKSRRGRHVRSTAAGASRVLILAMVLSLAMLPILGYLGYRTVKTSTRGDVLSGRANPDTPGYQALVDPTPVALVIQTDDENVPTMLTLLSLSGPGREGGAVIPIDPGTRLSRSAYGVTTMGDAARRLAPSLAGAVIGSTLHLGFTEVITINPARLATFLAPVRSLKIDNPAEVTTARGAVVPAGKAVLQSDQVAGYLNAESTAELPTARLDRDHAIWEAWISAVAGSKSQAMIVPGEADAGLGRYVRGLAKGTVDFGTLPVKAAAPIGAVATTRVDDALARLMLTNAVPFPVGGAPGDRVTVRVLNGTGPTALPQSLMQRVVYAGGQVTIIGNDTSFHDDSTTLTYSLPANATIVKKMAKLLGVGEVKYRPAIEGTTDITIVVGKDLMGNPPPILSPAEVGR